MNEETRQRKSEAKRMETKRATEERMRWKTNPTILLAVVLALGLAAPHNFVLAETERYADLKTAHWAYDAIEAMSQKEIVTGYPDGTFKPGETVTYGEFIKMAVTAGTGKDAGNAADGENWAEGYYDAAVAQRYFTGHDVARHQLPREIPRGDMALIVSSILGNEGPVANYDEIADKITDVSHNTKHEYKIIRAYESGVLTGYPDNTFRPQGTLTRAEAATVIYRLMQRLRGEEAEAEAEAGEIMFFSVGGWQKTTKERMKAGEELSEIGNWAATSTSRLPVADVISNTGDIFLSQNLKYYEIVTDCPYIFTTERDLVGTEDLKCEGADMKFMAYLVKDKKAIDLEKVGTHLYIPELKEGSNFPMDFEYLAFFEVHTEVILLIPNPYK